MTSFYTTEELAAIGFARIGDNVLISRRASIYGADRISIGNNVRIDDFCLLSGKIVIDDNVHVAAYCALFAGDYGIHMKSFTGISSRCVIYAVSDDYSGLFLTNPTVPIEYRNVMGGEVVLEKHALLGTGVTVLPNLRIGEGTSVGSMSLVLNSLDEWGIYVGIPCKRLKDRKRDLLELEEKYIRRNMI